MKNKTKIIIVPILAFSALYASGSGSSGGGGGAAGGSNSNARSAVAPTKRVEKAREELRKRVGETKTGNAQIDLEHLSFTELLRTHVKVLGGGLATQVDYKSFDRAKLKEYLKTLSNLNEGGFDALAKSDQLAFLINAYNAFTIELILEQKPKKSIKEIGFLRSPWSIKFIDLMGEKVSLDHIEHTLIRGSGRYNDPRIHFAVNCASVGCPALSNRAFVGATLDSHLEEVTKLFLQDRSRNRYDPRSDVFEVSSIFKWYRADFEKGDRGLKSLAQFLVQHVNDLATEPEAQAKIKAQTASIRFLDYDWKLNTVP